MIQGNDVAGRISRLPGGVAMNIAMALGGMGIKVALLTAVGADAEGEELLAAAERLGLDTRCVHTATGFPTDRYMAIESGGNLVAATADAHTLEAAGDKILAPLLDGRLASRDKPFCGMVAIDGNLTETMLAHIATSDLFKAADVRVAPASPGKAGRLGAFLGHARATLYVNLFEANTLTGRSDSRTIDAAAVLRRKGLGRALVTDGANAASLASSRGVCAFTPPRITARRVTGAGDVLMATHMAAELGGMDEEAALESAIRRAADYVASEEPL